MGQIGGGSATVTSSVGAAAAAGICTTFIGATTMLMPAIVDGDG